MVQKGSEGFRRVQKRPEFKSVPKAEMQPFNGVQKHVEKSSEEFRRVQKSTDSSDDLQVVQKSAEEFRRVQKSSEGFRFVGKVANVATCGWAWHVTIHL